MKILSPDDLVVGMAVSVQRKDDDLFQHDFIGRIHSHRNGNVVVEDQEGDCWEVDSSQCSADV